MRFEYVIKNGIFGNKVFYANGLPYKPKGAKFHFFKSDNKEDIDLEIEINGKRSPRLTAEKRTFETYSGKQVMFKVKGEYKYVNVNFENGEISPAFSGLIGSLCVDDNGRVFRLEDDGRTTYSDYTVGPKRITDDYLKQAEVLDANGKLGVIDEQFKEVIPFEHDEPFDFRALYFSNPNVYVVRRDRQNDFYYNGKKVLSSPVAHISAITEKGKDMFSLQEDEKTRTFYQIKGSKIEKMGSIQENIVDSAIVNGKYMVVSESGVWELENGECKKVFDGKMVDGVENEGENFAILEKNGKKGLYSLNKREVVVDTKYDKIDMEYSSAKKNHYLVGNHSDHQWRWGVVNEKGEEIVPIEYTRPYTTTVEIREVEDGFREDGIVVFKEDEKGNEKGYLLCTKADEVLSNRGPVYTSYDEDELEEEAPATTTGGMVKSSEEKWGIALGAAALFESPIAAVIAMNVMDDQENSL